MPTQLFERSRGGENALLIQPHAGGPPAEGVLEEFAELARSAGARVLATLPARIDKPNPSILIGSGKLEEVKAACEATGAGSWCIPQSVRQKMQQCKYCWRPRSWLSPRRQLTIM